MVLATALLLARITVREILQGTWLFLFACTSFFVIQKPTLPGTTEIFRILGKPIYVESAEYALASLVFVRSTDPRELAIALVTQMKIPYRIAYAFFIALRIIPTIEGEIKIIRSA
jgi:energy-coupling factor transport system permease protein